MSSAAYRWIRRLARFATFTPDEHRLLEEVSAITRRCAINDDLQKTGEPSARVFIVLEGLACQQKLLPDGRRQILAYMFPGDMGDPRDLLQSHVDHSLCVIWPSEITSLTPGSLKRLERFPNILQAMSRYASTQRAIGREWLVNVGHRTASARLAHLVCELYTRLQAVGLTHNLEFALPLTQAEIGDTLALSSVHVNRTLMELRRLRLVTFHNRHVVIHDFPGLQAMAGFDPAYLHLNEQAHHHAAVAV